MLGYRPKDLKLEGFHSLKEKSFIHGCQSSLFHRQLPEMRHSFSGLSAGKFPINPIVGVPKLGSSPAYCISRRSQLYRSPDRGFGNVIGWSVVSREEKYYDAFSYLFCYTASADLLQVVLPSLSLGCLLFLSRNPAFLDITILIPILSTI